MSKERRLKVYYGHRQKSYKKYPVIRLGGKYISQAGFAIGDKLHISVEQGRIFIAKHL